jgi:ACS family hexuronate transporter-like MFS transporter
MTPSTPAPVRVGRVRWVVAALLFSAMVFNYVDRQMLAVLKPTLSVELHWSETQYADMVFWFQAAYAISYVAFGRIVDRVGARIGFTLTFIIWSVAQIAHGAARGAVQFMLARALLGLGEGGAYPAALSAVGDWFPRQERAFAVGLLNAGVNIGAIVTPLVVPAVVLTFGWRAAFVITGLASLVWLAAWLAFYRSPDRSRRLGSAERAFIQSDPVEASAPVALLRLLRTRETWAYAAAKFLIDPIWWMFLFWLPDFLAKRFGLDLKTFGPPLVVIYLMSDAGNLVGGWASGALIRRGLSVNRARKLTMLGAALLATPVALAAQADSLWLAVAIIGLATAAHQAFSVNLFTLPSDLFPRRAIGSVVGIGGACGAIGGMAMAKYAGWVLERLGSYAPMFAVAASAYLMALLIIHLASPRLAPVSTERLI